MILFISVFICFVIAAIFIISTLELRVHEKYTPKTKTRIISLFAVCMIVCSLFVFQFIQNYKGTPRSINAVSDFAAEVIVYGQVVDQDKELIYLLLTKKGEDLPAIYFVTTYKEELHKALAEGLGEFKGKPFKLEAKKTKGQGKSAEAKEGEETSISNESESYLIGELPPPVLPEKI
jgi:hypothetical protein